MWAQVGVKRRSVRCIIGILDHERVAEQELFVSVSVKALLPEADVMDDAYDYRWLAELCERVALKGRFQLVETYVRALVDAVKARGGVRGVRVLVEKPDAIAEADCAFVEYTEEWE